MCGPAGRSDPLGPVDLGTAIKLARRWGYDVKGIPADVARYAYACTQCGYCIEECDQFYGRGWESQSPRGKWDWLRELMEGREKWDQFMVDTMLVCTTCELCNLRCSASLPIEPSWLKLRGLLVRDNGRMTFPPFEMMAAATRKEGDIWAGYRKDRSAWFPKDLVEKHGPSRKAKALYFAGCTASYVENDIGMASVRLLDAAGVDFTYLKPRPKRQIEGPDGTLVNDPSDPDNFDLGRNLSMTVSALAEVVKDLITRIDALEKKP